VTVEKNKIKEFSLPFVFHFLFVVGKRENVKRGIERWCVLVEKKNVTNNNFKCVGAFFSPFVLFLLLFFGVQCGWQWQRMLFTMNEMIKILLLLFM
jgi:hypothetical protein